MYVYAAPRLFSVPLAAPFRTVCDRESVATTIQTPCAVARARSPTQNSSCGTFPWRGSATHAETGNPSPTDGSPE